jgi:hypothetical protein
MKLSKTLNNSSFVLFISIALNLSDKAEFEQLLSKHGARLIFLGRKHIAHLIANDAIYKPLSGLMNGNLYGIIHPKVNTLSESKSFIATLNTILTNYNHLIYGLKWNNLLYSNKEVISMLETKTTLPLQISYGVNVLTPTYIYLRFLFILYNYKTNQPV